MTISLLDQRATCEACGWDGKVNEAATLHFQHDLGSDSSVADALLSEMRGLFAKTFALPLAQLLVKWGFIQATMPKDEAGKRLHVRDLGRYIDGAARASLTSFIETRKAIELRKKPHVG